MEAMGCARRADERLLVGSYLGDEMTAASKRRRKPQRAKQLGVTDDDYARMLEAQSGGCAICTAKPKTRRLHVDHDHKTGEVRGLLCHRCNRALQTWMNTNWLHAAIAYVAEPRSVVR